MAINLSSAERRRLTVLLRDASAYRRNFGPALRPAELSAAAAESLLALARHAPATVSQLADLLERDQPAISRALADLRQSGLVAEESAPGRRAPHSLTRAGESTVRAYLARTSGSGG